MAKENKLSVVSDTARCDCSHGAQADGKQTHSPFMQICAENTPRCWDERNTKLTNLMTELEPELTAAKPPSGSSVKHMVHSFPDNQKQLKLHMPKTRAFLEA